MGDLTTAYSAVHYLDIAGICMILFFAISLGYTLDRKANSKCPIRVFGIVWILIYLISFLLLYYTPCENYFGSSTYSGWTMGPLLALNLYALISNGMVILALVCFPRFLFPQFFPKN